MQESAKFPGPHSLKQVISRTQVVIFAGGLGKRMGGNLPKALMRLNGQTLIERCVRYFMDVGFSDFVFVLRHGHEMVSQGLREVDLNDIKTSFSIDTRGIETGRENGRAKALRYAIEMGHIDVSKRCFVTYPDDVFTDGTLPLRILSEHLQMVDSMNTLGSVVLTRGMNWPYGTAEVDHMGLVRSFAEKPFIPQPTSVGNYVLEPEVYNLISDCVDMEFDGPLELEQTVIPWLSRGGKLHGIFIPNSYWLPINTLKDLDDAEKALSLIRPREITTLV